MPPFRLLSLLLLSSAVPAEARAAEPIHWAYSAYFGTGRYALDTGEDAYIIGLRPRRQWREPAFDETQGRTLGLELRVPVAVGAYRFDAADLGATLGLDNVGTVSAVPGVEIEIPINARWSVKPLAYVGWGMETDGDGSAWMYWSGIKSRLLFRAGPFEGSLVNALTYVGYAASSGERGNVLPLLTGIELARPLADKKVAGEQVHLHWHASYTRYLNEISFGSAGAAPPLDIDDEWELGVAFSTGERPLRLWRLRWDRVGVAYRFSSDGEFAGVGLVFHSLFDR